MLSENPGDSPLKYPSDGLVDCGYLQALLSVSPVSEFCAERMCESVTTSHYICLCSREKVLISCATTIRSCSYLETEDFFNAHCCDNLSVL